MPDDQIDRDETVGLAHEELTVVKRTVSNGFVRLSTHVEEHLEQVRDTLSRVEVEIERVSIGRVVDAVPEIRTEGDTLVYPIVEEIVVKQLVLREEVRITRRQRSEPFAQDITLRRVRADVEHVPAPPRPASPPEQT